MDLNIVGAKVVNKLGETGIVSEVERTELSCYIHVKYSEEKKIRYSFRSNAGYFTEFISFFDPQVQAEVEQALRNDKQALANKKQEEEKKQKTSSNSEVAGGTRAKNTYTLSRDKRYFKIDQGILKRYYSEPGTNTVVIPDTVTAIGGSAFTNCKKSGVIIPKSVTTLCNYAFSGWNNLTRIKLPESITSIGTHAFSRCRSLSALKIPSSVTEFGMNIFDACYGLEDKDGFIILGNDLFSCRSKKKEVDIPEGVKCIRPGAFLYSAAEKINLPSGVTEIDHDAFRGSSVTEIFIPDSVTRIGDKAFYSCASLKVIRFPETLKELGKAVLSGCESLAVTHLSRNVFRMMSQSDINRVTSPLMVPYFRGESTDEEIERFVLEAIKHKSTYKPFIEYCIEQDDPCLISMLEKQKVMPIDEIDELLSEAEDKLQVKTALLEYKNRHYDALQISEHETEMIEKELGLREKTLSDWRKEFVFSIKEDKIRISGVRGKGHTVVIPGEINGKKVILENGMFLGNTVVTKAVLPDNMTVIPGQMFKGCTNLAEIKLPKSVMVIGAFAFAGCRKLEQITIPESIECIHECAFSYTGLKELILPNTELGTHVFHHSDLKKVVIKDGKLKIQPRAFEECINLKSCELPDSIREIGEGAFRNCFDLVDLVLPRRLRRLDYNAFSNCKSLRQITIPDTVEEIKYIAFQGCDSLEEVTIPRRFEKIVDRIFTKCPNLKKINYTGSVDNESRGKSR